MHQPVTTDAQNAAFNLPSALKRIKDNLVSRDLKTLKFLCSDLIPPRTMESVNSALNLFDELLKKLEISPRGIAELLYLIHQNRLISTLQYSVEDIKRIVDEGKGFCNPCRVLLYRISEHITNDQLGDLLMFCPQISRAAAEKIKDPLDLFLALERLCLINVRENNLQFLREILSAADFVEEAKHIDQYLHKQRNKPVIAQSSSTSQGTSHHTNPQNISYRNPVNLRPNYTATGSNNNASINISTPKPTALNFPRHAGVPSSSLCTFSVACTEDAPAGGQIAGQAASANQCENSDDFYPMTHEPRGICLIINNENFHGGKVLEPRKGSEKDCHLLKNIFEKELKFNVIVRHDLTDEEILNVLRQMASLDHSDFDCFVCFILSHGEEGSVYGANGKPVPLKNVTGCFVPRQCRSLLDKPKLFFIQACQGGSYQEACRVQTDSEGDKAEATPAPVGVAALKESIPSMGDFFIFLSTVPGYVSFRSPSRGSWFITTLEKLLRAYADSKDLDSIVTRVKCEVSRAEDEKDGRICKQVPMSTGTLRKKVKFL